MPLYANGIEQVNTPYFEARLSTAQTGISNGAWVKVQLNQKNYDSGTYFDNTTNYRYTPLVAGKYYFTGTIINALNADTTISMVGIYKNGSRHEGMLGTHRTDYSSSEIFSMHTTTFSSIIDMNGTTDYVELWGLHQVNSGSAGFGAEGTMFKGFKFVG